MTVAQQAATDSDVASKRGDRVRRQYQREPAGRRGQWDEAAGARAAEVRAEGR